MKKYLSCLIVVVAIFFTACGTKRQYFDPNSVKNGDFHSSSLGSSGNLSSSILETNLNFAKLKNNEVLDHEGEIADFKLEKNYQLLLYKDNEFVVADKDGNLKILNANHEEIFSHQFDAEVLSVDISGDDLALVLADNTMVLFNRSLGIKFIQSSGVAVATDSRVAAPIFLDSIILYPSLDGKLNIVDRANLRVIRNIVISTDEFFNNIIYLNIINNQMIAATASKIVVVTPEQTFSMDEEIKNIALFEDEIFIFTKDGKIIKSNLKLDKLKEVKFNFAIFNEANIYQNSVYAFEKTGYILKMDLNLENIQIFKFKDAENAITFMGNTKLFYKSKFLNLP